MGHEERDNGREAKRISPIRSTPRGQILLFTSLLSPLRGVVHLMGTDVLTCAGAYLRFGLGGQTYETIEFLDGPQILLWGRGTHPHFPPS